MKRPTLGNDGMVSVYSGRTYFSPSSNKNSLASLQKSLLGISFNSPKSESHKAFMFSKKPSTNLLRASAKIEKSSLGEQRKVSKNNSESYPRTPSTSSTYGGPSRSTRPANKLRGSSTNISTLNKSKGEVMSASTKQYSVPKYPESLSMKDALLKQTRTRNLEIDTEIQTFKDTGAMRAYSTKNKDYKSKLYGNVSPNGTGTNASIDYSHKYSHLINHNSTGNLRYDSRTEPNDERLGMTPQNKQKNVLSKILSNTTEKSRSALIRKPPLEDNSLLINQSSPNTLKVNNFFSNAKRKELENSLYKKDKSLNLSIKLDSEKGEVSRSAELNKKITNKVRQDHKATYKAMAYYDDSKDDFKKTDQDSKNLSLTYTTPSMNNLYTNPSYDTKPTNPSPKVSLNSFITKVEKGSALPIRVKRDENNREEFAAPVKPYLSLEDKTKGNKGLDLSKTTTNSEAKTITFSKNKMNQQALASSSQEGLKARVRGTTPTNKETHESFNETAIQKPSFTYYMTSLEKYHRKWNEMDYFCQIYKEHFIQSFQALTFCKYLKPVDSKTLAQKKVFLPKRPSHKDKKTIIFDLDETLIHCNESSDVPSDIILPIRFPHGEVIEAGINIRPYANEILKEISQHFEIIVFTASHSCYANVVLDHLDPGQQYIHHRLFRESCVVTDEGIYIKDLRIIGNRNLQDVVLVDNAAYSFGYQIENGIPIIPYYDNKEDQELKHLIPYLKSLANVKDVREVNKQTFKLHTYSMYDGLEKVMNKVVLQS